MANKIVFGLSHVHIAVADDLSAYPVPTWESPVAVPGAVSFSRTPEGQELKFFADNGLYYYTTTNEGYTGELEMALIPDALLAELMGWAVDENGMLVEDADALPKDFALMGQILGDERNRRFVFYSCKAARGSEENQTRGESVDPQTTTLSIVMTPLMVEDKPIIRGIMERIPANETEYDEFFSAVLLPDWS